MMNEQYGGPPKKNNTLNYILIAVGLSCCGVCGIGGYMMVQGARAVVGQALPVASCAIQFDAARDGLVQYAQDKGAYPKAETWMDDIAPYYEKNLKKLTDEMKTAPDMFKMKFADSGSDLGCQLTDKVKHGIAMNLAIAGKKPADIKSDTILVFETETAKRNQTLPWKKRSEKTGPQVMGELREWLELTATSKSEFQTERGKKIGAD